MDMGYLCVGVNTHHKKNAAKGHKPAPHPRPAPPPKKDEPYTGKGPGSGTPYDDPDEDPYNAKGPGSGTPYETKPGQDDDATWKAQSAVVPIDDEDGELYCWLFPDALVDLTG